MEMLNGFHPSFSGFALTYLPYLVIFNEARLQNNIGFKESVHPPARHWPDITLLFSRWNTRTRVNVYIHNTISTLRYFTLNYGYLNMVRSDLLAGKDSSMKIKEEYLTFEIYLLFFSFKYFSFFFLARSNERIF